MPVEEKYGMHLSLIISSTRIRERVKETAVTEVDDDSGRLKRLLPTAVSAPVAYAGGGVVCEGNVLTAEPL